MGENRARPITNLAWTNCGHMNHIYITMKYHKPILHTFPVERLLKNKTSFGYELDTAPTRYKLYELLQSAGIMEK
jgi:hypothetical protein